MAERYDPKYKTKVCTRCGGDGVYTVPLAEGGGTEVDCATCRTLGKELVRQETILNAEIVYTYEILEATDITEYGNLSDTNKNAYNMALQCGIVDLTDGTQIRANLWAMFDAESDTRANLITLLGE